MAFNFGTTIESMDKGANDLDSTAQHLTSRLNELQSELDAVFSGWVGEASNSYRALQHRWNDDQKTMIKALNNLSVALKHASDYYQKTELAAKDAVTAKN